MNKLQHYLDRHDEIPGWLDAYSARFIADLSRIQLEGGARGGVGEIGVHMGRLFILLKLLTTIGERAVAIDVFKDQHLNLDDSGHGDEAQFRANLERWASSYDVTVIQRSSLNVTGAEIIAAVGRCRLFSIDGGHTAECALNDLRLADEILDDCGVAILDDYFNQSWPDVSVGAARFLNDETTRLRPFAITPNKLYLARPDFHPVYSAILRVSQGDYFEKDSRMLDWPVGIFGVEPRTHRLAKRLKIWAKASLAGPYLLQARDRLRATMGQ
jgi:hypothetical protein